METSAPSRPAAPAVVAVVVTRDPGSWFDETLAALAAQDYSNLAVLIIDAASTADPTARVAAVLPRAFVRKLDENNGFGASANEALEVVDGAAFYCFFHDDAAPEPDAIRTMVSEALRSNAGIVGPKLVHWDDTRRLLQVGDDVDKVGERAHRVEPGELDQEQHDSVRDVFLVPGACTLVRADLFAAIGGYDDGIDLLNDDLNLCWRAHLAGARVVVAPDAVVRHVEALGDRSPLDERRFRLVRHRVRTMLTCYSAFHLLRVLPQALLIAVAEVLYSVIVGRRGQASEIVRAWRWNLDRRDEIRERRKKVAAFRQVSDSEVRRFQRRGSARMAAFVRGQLGRGGHRSERAAGISRELQRAVLGGEFRWPIAAWTLTVVILLIGSRHLLFTPVPAVGEFVPFDEGPVALAQRYLSGWRDAGLGSESASPTAFALLAGAGAVFFGSMELLRTVSVLGCLVGGIWGAFRLLRPTGSRPTQAVGLVTYAAAPLAYNAIADANWSALATYAVLPWCLGSLAKAAKWAPFGDLGGDVGPGVHETGPVIRATRLGLLLAIVGAFAPAALIAVALLVAGLALGSLLAGTVRGIARVVATAGMAVACAVALNMPWAFEFVLPGAAWEQLAGQRGQADPVSVIELLRFELGPVGGSSLGLGLLIAGLLPLLIGSDWRLQWAVRSWAVIIVSLIATWVGENELFFVDLPAAEILLAPALLGLATATALGVTAFEVDLRAYGFGWRQIVSGLALVTLAIGATPTMLDAGNGRWYLPSGGLESTFSSFDVEDSGFRVLWLGDPDVLPVDSYALTDNVAYGTTIDGLPSISDHWSGSPIGATALLTDALQLAREGQTSRLGRLLAPMGVRYVVVVGASAPAPLGGVERPMPADVLATLEGQLDLRQVRLNPAYVVFRNEAALSMRSIVDPMAGLGASLDITAADLANAEPVLLERDGPTTFTGTLPAGARVLLGAGAADGWELSSGGRNAPRSKLFGWANGFDTAASGEATLRYNTSVLRYAVIAVQVVFWLIALRVATRKPEPIARPEVAS